MLFNICGATNYGSLQSLRNLKSMYFQIISKKKLLTKRTGKLLYLFWLEFLNKIGARQLDGEGVGVKNQKLKDPTLCRYVCTLKWVPGR